MLTGCADYLNHRDSVTFGLGNAVEANKGIHTVDPFPPEAWRTHIDSDGKVIYRAVKDYQSGNAGIQGSGYSSPSLGSSAMVK